MFLQNQVDISGMLRGVSCRFEDFTGFRKRLDNSEEEKKVRKTGEIINE